jgi:HPt (histidine-containing phosphotransfer) domain-containing protein
MLDHNHFLMMTGGDRALQSEVADLFRGQAEAWRAALTEDAAGAWREAVHKLRGSARGIGFWALADACEAAEQAASGEAGPWLENVRALLAAALDDLRGY